MSTVSALSPKARNFARRLAAALDSDQITLKNNGPGSRTTEFEGRKIEIESEPVSENGPYRTAFGGQHKPPTLRVNDGDLHYQWKIVHLGKAGNALIGAADRHTTRRHRRGLKPR